MWWSEECGKTNKKHQNRIGSEACSGKGHMAHAGDPEKLTPDRFHPNSHGSALSLFFGCTVGFEWRSFRQKKSNHGRVANGASRFFATYHTDCSQLLSY